MSAPAARQIQPREQLKPTLRDKAQRCRVERAFGDYFKVTGEGGTPYAVKAVWDERGRDVTASCLCLDAVCRQHQCKHSLAVVMFERARVAGAQGFYC